MTVSVKYYAYNDTCKYKGVTVMNFSAYIERQKSIIRSRHEGETFLIHKGETIRLSESEKLLNDIEDMRGLNKTEREFYRYA